MEETEAKTRKEQARERAARGISKLRPEIRQAIEKSKEKANTRRERIREAKEEAKKAGEKLQALSLAIRCGKVTDWEELAQELDKIREKMEKLQALDFENSKQKQGEGVQ